MGLTPRLPAGPPLVGEHSDDGERRAHALIFIARRRRPIEILWKLDYRLKLHGSSYKPPTGSIATQLLWRI